jgi:hypothetical protein
MARTASPSRAVRQRLREYHHVARVADDLRHPRGGEIILTFVAPCIFLISLVIPGAHENEHSENLRGEVRGEMRRVTVTEV